MTDRVRTPSGPRPWPGSDARRIFVFDSAGVSHNGAVRDHNEDFAFAGEVLLAVADGVAGNARGEVASEIAIAAIEYLEHRMYRKPPDDEVDEAARYADRRVEDEAGRHPELRGMATTLTALRLDGESVVVGQVGDSRAYRLRAGQCERLTKDDSLVQGLVDAGVLTPEQAARHPARSVILQALGNGSVQPTIGVLEVYPADRYLVCSDGLTDYVDEQRVGAILAGEPDREACCAALLAAALEAGAPDNVTCVVGDVRRRVVASG